MSLIAALAGGHLKDLAASILGALHVKVFSSAPGFISRQRLSVSDTFIGLILPPGAYMAYIQCFTADIYYTRDLSTPSSTNGHALYIGDDLYIYGNTHLSNFRALRQGATDAGLEISYYREDEGDQS